ncbi:MAG: DEAD/DEAH box helicase family protein [Psychroflexus halocasei]
MSNCINAVAQTYLEVSDVKHTVITQNLNYDKKSFTYLKNHYTNDVSDTVSINEIEQLLRTYKKAKGGKNKDRCLLKGLFKNGYSGSDCYKNSPYLFFDIDVKDKEDKKENIHLLDKITNEKIFKKIQEISVLCWRSNSGFGMAGIFYVPQIVNYLEPEKEKHLAAGKAVTKYVSQYLYEATGIKKIDFDQAQSKFRQLRYLAEQKTAPKVNHKPFKFTYKIVEKVREYKKNVPVYRAANYKSSYGSIYSQFDNDHNILDIALNNGFSEVSRSNGKVRILHPITTSSSSGTVDINQNVFFNHSQSFDNQKKAFTPSSLLCKLQFNNDFKALREHLNSLGYTDKKKDKDEVKQASKDLKRELENITDLDEAGKLIFSYCYDLQTLEPQHKRKFVKETCLRPELEKYFTSYLGLVDLKIKYDKELTINKYVAEVLPDVIDYTEKHKKVIMRADTGKGKTTAIAREFHKHRPNARVLVLEPLLIIIEQNRKEYEDRAIFLDGNSVKDKSLRDAADYESLVFATYKQGLKLLKKGSQFDFIIIDEVHQLLTANSFKSQEISDLTGTFYDTCLIGLTGTPTNIFKQIGYKLIDVDVKKPEPVNVEVRYLNNKPYTIALNHLRNVKGKTLLRLNDVKGLEILKSQLVSSKLYKKNEILVLYSTKENKSSKDFKQLAHQRKFDENIRLVLTTSLIDEGLSINQENFTDVVFIEAEYSPRPEPIKQFFARFRNKDNQRNNYLYLRTKNNQEPSRYKPAYAFKDVLRGLEYDADNINSDEVLTSYKAIFSNDRFYYQDSEINLYYLAYHITDIYFRTLNALQFLEYLKTNYNLETKVNDNYSFDESLKSLSSEKRKNIKRLIANYWLLSKDEVLQVLALNTQNTQIKKELTVKQIPINPALENFTIKHIKDFEKLYSRFKKLESLGVEEPNDILIKNDLDITLTSNKKYKEQLVLIQLEKIIYEPKNAADKRTVLKLENLVKWCIEKKEITNNQLYRQLRKQRLFSSTIYNEKMFFCVLDWLGVDATKDTNTGLIKIG